MYRNYGSKERYFNEMPGLNSRLDACQAGILRIKLPILTQWNQMRAELAQEYFAHLADIESIVLPTIGKDCTHVWHLFVILAEQRDALKTYLAEQGIATLIHYPLPPHLQEAYAALGFQPGQFPIAEELAQKCLSLPLYPGMPIAHVANVAAAIRAFYFS